MNYTLENLLMIILNLTDYDNVSFQDVSNYK